MQIVEDTALQVRLPEDLSNKVLQHVERSEVVSRTPSHQDLLVYWGYRESSYLAYLLDEEQPNDAIPDIPSPILRDYKWPGIHQPFNHQKTTASFLSLRQRAFCFNEAGTGKTSAAIWAADYLMDIGVIKKVLIVCPLSIMYTAWQADVFKTAMHRTCGVAHGEREKRVKVLNANYDFVVINFDGVGTVFDELVAQQFDLIIIDEANGYKNPQTRRWKTLAKLITASTRLWMMTGTPASQGPLDAFGLARLVSPHRVPKYITAWRHAVLIQRSKFVWQPKPDSKDRVHYALQPAVRFTKKECLDLPEVVYQTRDVPMTPQVHQYYKKLKDEFLIEAAGEEVTAINAAARLNKLLQLSGGAVYTDNRDVIEFDISPRLNALMETLDETSNKVLVFVPYHHTIQVVTEFLSKHGVTNEVISGDVSASARSRLIDKFQQQADPKVLVIQPQAASHGVTLTAADTVVFWSPVMSVETYIQCIGRIDRVGQKNSMTVVHLQGSDVERRVYKMLQGKVDSHQQLVDLYKQELNS
jgi:SNF2 family DNA or RNA helicase